LLILVMAFAWGRRNVTNLYRYLDGLHHRSGFNNFFLVQRWDPKGALRYGQNLFRRRRTATLVIAKPHGPIRHRFMDAGWLKVSTLGA
jgi:hypothetical protein